MMRGLHRGAVVDENDNTSGGKFPDNGVRPLRILLTCREPLIETQQTEQPRVDLR